MEFDITMGKMQLVRVGLLNEIYKWGFCKNTTFGKSVFCTLPCL